MNESALPAAPRHTYTLPESARQLPTDPKTVTFKLLTVAEEEKASSTAEALKVTVAVELIKHAVVAVDGTTLTWDNGAKEQFIEGCSPKVRELLLAAFRHCNRATSAEEDAFLASAAASV